MKSFSELFKLYRLRSAFANLSEFADAFADKGYFYDLSIFSHWQNGKRIPARREVLIALVEVFIENAAITSLDQANDFLESAGQGYLTKKEQVNLVKRTSLHGFIS